MTDIIIGSIAGYVLVYKALYLSWEINIIYFCFALLEN